MANPSVKSPWRAWLLAALLSCVAANGAAADAGADFLKDVQKLADQDLQAAVRKVEAHLQTARRRDDREGEVIGLLASGGLERRQGHYGQAVLLFERAENLASGLADRSIGARAAADLGVTNALASLHSDALAAYRRALPVMVEVGDWRRASGVLGNIGTTLSERGDNAAAREHYERALAMKREHDVVQGVGVLLNNLADLVNTDGDRERAIALLRDAIEAHRAEGSLSGESLARSNLAPLLAESGRIAEAREQLVLAERLLPEGDRRLHTALLRATANVESAAAEQGEDVAAYARAAAAAEQALDLARQMDDPERRSQLLRQLSEIRAHQGRYQEALTLLQDAEREQRDDDRRTDSERYAVLAARYDSEKQSREIAELRQREALQTAALDRQRNLVAALVGSGLALVIVVVLLRMRERERRRFAAEVESRNAALAGALADTERMRARAERLAELNGHLLQLAGSDLRAPLLQIRNVAERLLVERGGDGSLSRQVAAIAQSAGELIRVADQMAESVALSDVPQPTEHETADIGGMLEILLSEVAARQFERGRLLRFSGSGPLRVKASAERLHHLLHELVDLVLEENPGTVQINASLSREQGDAVLRIDDPGGRLCERLLLTDHAAANARNPQTLGLTWLHGAVFELGGDLSGHARTVELRLPADGGS